MSRAVSGRGEAASHSRSMKWRRGNGSRRPPCARRCRATARPSAVRSEISFSDSRRIVAGIGSGHATIPTPQPGSRTRLVSSRSRVSGWSGSYEPQPPRLPESEPSRMVRPRWRASPPPMRDDHLARKTFLSVVVEAMRSVDPLLSAHRLGLLVRATARDFLANCAQPRLSPSSAEVAPRQHDPQRLELFDPAFFRASSVSLDQVARSRQSCQGRWSSRGGRGPLEAQRRPRCHRGSRSYLSKSGDLVFLA